MTFSLIYTAPDGQRIRFTMSNYPALSVQLARSMAEQLYSEVKLGGDPQRQKQTARTIKPIPKLGDFIDQQYSLWYQTQFKALKIRSTFNQFSFIYSKPINTITGRQIEQWRGRLHKEGLSPATSNR